MDYTFSPWRYAYVSNADSIPGCLFCTKLAEGDDRAAWIVHRSQHCFLMLNAFPYTSGHVMIVPYEHAAQLDAITAAARAEMMELTARTEGVLRRLYKPDGINIGMNIGKAAGAGVAGHIHMHALPRWFADANFMSVIGETRVLPEALVVTFERIAGEFGS